MSAARETPYDVVFRHGSIDFEGERFAEIVAEAEQRGVALDDPERFAMLGSVGALLREMMLDAETPDEAGELWQAVPAAAIAQTGALVYHALRFHAAGARVHPLDADTLRATLQAPPPAPGSSLPTAGYVQLPRNLIWARADADGPAEPLDGFFFARGRHLDVLLALGVRPRRPGFTAIPLAIDADDAADLARIAAAPAREVGADFANILPGGELDGLLGLTSAGEAMRLAALCILTIAPSDDG